MKLKLIKGERMTIDDKDPVSLAKRYNLHKMLSEGLSWLSGSQQNRMMSELEIEKDKEYRVHSFAMACDIFTNLTGLDIVGTAKIVSEAQETNDELIVKEGGKPIWLGDGDLSLANSYRLYQNLEQVFKLIETLPMQTNQTSNRAIDKTACDIFEALVGKKIEIKRQTVDVPTGSSKCK